MCLSFQHFADLFSCRTGQRHHDSEDDVSTVGKGQGKLADATRFEDAATLQSGWSPPQYYGQDSQPSAGVKTLKEEINVAETERVKMGRQAVKENGSAHEGVEGETVESIVALEKKEKADLIVSESVVLKDSSKEKDQEKKADGTSYYASVSSTTSVVSSRLDELRGGRKPWGQSKETTEEVNIKLKESISGGQTTTTAATSLPTTVTAEVPEKRDFRKEFEERRERRRQQREAEEEEERARIARREESRRKREEASELRRKEELENRRREETRREEARRLRKEKSEDRRSEGERERSKERREREREGSKERQDVERESSKERLFEGERERSRDLRRDLRPRERSEEGKERHRREERARESSEEKVRSPRREKETKAKEEKEEVAKRAREEEEAKKETEEVKETPAKDAEEGELAPAPAPAPAEVPPSAAPVPPEDTPPAEAVAEPADAEAAAPESERGGEGEAEAVVVGGVVSALKAENVYVSSSEDLSHDDSRRDLSVHEDPKGDLALLDEAEAATPPREDAEASPPEVIPEVEVIITKHEDASEPPEAPEEAPAEGVGEQAEEGVAEAEEEAREDVSAERPEQEDELESPAKRQLFPDVVAECEAREADLPVKREGFRPKWAEPGATLPEDAVLADVEAEARPEVPELGDATTPPLSPRAQSLAALDALIHGRPQGVNAHDQAPPTSPSAALEPPPPIQEDEEEIVYDHTVTSAQHKLQFCTTPVTVEGIAPDQESHGTDPDPLPPPIPPHGIDPATVAGVDLAQAARPLTDPEIMTPEEAQRLLSANIVEGKVREGQTLLSDEEAQEVVLLLSPQEKDTPQAPPPVPPHYSDIPSIVPPHYADVTPPVPPHYGPGEDEYDMRLASRFDPTLTSPLSPEEEPSEADSSEASGDVSQVSRVKEVLVEDGVHYLEDGHFWVEVPGLPEEDEEDELDPTLPFHQHTRLTFSKDPIQVFSTYSVTEYDRKNDEVDPVAASAEYELEKRVEKMDVFPVEIVKGEGGLGLSIIGMGVGADAGVEKLGIFVKTITPGGATERDARIQVNDQIIEVDGKSLVGVTQVFAASVLKNTSGRVHFLIGREKDPENSEVALLIKQSLQADMEREERRRALGGPDYDPHANHGLFDPLSSPSEENSRSEDMSMHHNNYSYMEGGSSPTSPDAVSPPAEVFDLEGDTSDTSPDNDVAMLKLKLKEVQYRNAVAEAEIQKLKMKLLDMEKILEENNHFSSQLRETRNQMSELEEKLQAKTTEVSTYQDMLEQSQGQYIVLEKKYYKAKKIIKEYQGRERDFLHREEYHITQLEDKDSHYNALVKALKDRVISLEAELTNAQKTAGLPVQVPADANTQPAYWQLQQSAQSAKPPRKPSLCTLDPEISDTETSDTGNSEGDKANTVERKMPVKEELDEAVPPHELLDVSASRAKGELAARGGLANRHLPSLKKTTSMSSAGSQDHSLDDSSLDDELPESQKHVVTEPVQDLQQDVGIRRSADILESPLPPPQSILPPSIMAKSTKTPPPPPPYSHLGSPPPYQHPPGQFSSGRQPLAPSHSLPDPPSSLPMRPLGAGMDGQPHHDTQSESRPEIPYRHPPPVARVLPVNRAEISESSSLASHLANRTPQQQSLAEQLKALLAERDLQTDGAQHRNERDVSPNKRSPTSLMEDVRQAVLQADVSSHVVPSGQMVHQLGSPQRTQPSVHYTPGGRESLRESNAGSGSPELGPQQYP
ncbi:microtubule-associated protein futsch-like isoform X2 [Penaeus japonicus]|uniref:microtubule-associated protein futsch-like isoform X2 n=1 Tax=Penaeus japonicus TaxID=27405 RepID=UPI001C716901|nr:microtubule-associated protein futsch-like isoform X2 [Penaeus japonicus]